MKRMARQCVLVIGMPGSGKTTLVRRMTDAYAERSSIDSIFILDRTEEWSVQLEHAEGDLEEQLDELLMDNSRRKRGETMLHDGPIVRSLEEYREYCSILAEEHGIEPPTTVIPRRVVWRLGPDPTSYGPALREAVDQGNVMIVFTEAQEWFRTMLSQWPEVEIREDVTLASLWQRGRAHIRDRHGNRCRIHILADTQYPQQVHWYLRTYAETVLTSRIEGGDALEHVRKFFGDGKETVERVKKLEKRQWYALRGTMPELAPFRGGGRA